MIRFIVIVCIVLLCVSCITQQKDFITHPQRKATGKVPLLRMDGGYWAIYERPDKSTGRGKDIGCFFFYENGIALWYDATGYREERETDPDVLRRTISGFVASENSRVKDDKPAGGYTIDASGITIQIFRYTKYKWELCSFKGQRINDSTVYIDGCNIEESKDYCREKFYLRFLSMEKPDSTNRLMKKKWYYHE